MSNDVGCLNSACYAVTPPLQSSRCAPGDHCQCDGLRLCSDSGYCMGNAGVCTTTTTSTTTAPDMFCCGASLGRREAAGVVHEVSSRANCQEACAAVPWCDALEWDASNPQSCFLVANWDGAVVAPLGIEEVCIRNMEGAGASRSAGCAALFASSLLPATQPPPPDTGSSGSVAAPTPSSEDGGHGDIGEWMRSEYAWYCLLLFVVVALIVFVITVLRFCRTKFQSGAVTCLPLFNAVSRRPQASEKKAPAVSKPARGVSPNGAQNSASPSQQDCGSSRVGWPHPDPASPSFAFDPRSGRASGISGPHPQTATPRMETPKRSSVDAADAVGAADAADVADSATPFGSQKVWCGVGQSAGPTVHSQSPAFYASQASATSAASMAALRGAARFSGASTPSPSSAAFPVRSPTERQPGLGPASSPASPSVFRSTWHAGVPGRSDTSDSLPLPPSPRYIMDPSSTETASSPVELTVDAILRRLRTVTPKSERPRVFKEQCLAWHPDKNTGCEKRAQAAFQRLQSSRDWFLRDDL